jgi:DNA-binding NarL/FixJ family response regulator
VGTTDHDDRVGVLAVDDQPVFLEAAREVVAATEGFRWVAGVSCGEDALAAIGEHEPDLVLLDVRMPGMDGIETARHIAERHPDVVVVLISLEDRLAIGPGAGRCGAVTVVRKQEFGPAMLRRLWHSHSSGDSA